MDYGTSTGRQIGGTKKGWRGACLISGLMFAGSIIFNTVGTYFGVIIFYDFEIYLTWWALKTVVIRNCEL